MAELVRWGVMVVVGSKGLDETDVEEVCSVGCKLENAVEDTGVLVLCMVDVALMEDSKLDLTAEL